MLDFDSFEVLLHVFGVLECYQRKLQATTVEFPEGCDVAIGIHRNYRQVKRCY